MSNNQSADPDDLTTLLLMIMGGLAMGGAGVLGVLFAPVRNWMVDHHVLATGNDIVLAFPDGVGLGVAQLIVLGGLLVTIVVLSIMWKTRRVARQAGR